MSDALEPMTKEELIEMFKEKGLTVTIDGCGCCDSPSVKVTSQGRIFDDEYVIIKMHEEMEGQDDE